MRKFCIWAAIAAAFSACAMQAQRIEVTIPAASRPLTGHLILVFAKTDNPEPRMQMDEQYRSAQGFGVDVSDLALGQPIVVDAETFGYPQAGRKLHLAVGDGDTYFLNNAVHILQDQLARTRHPHSDATFQYGPHMPHCYTGGPSEYTMQQNNADWPQRVLPMMVEHTLAIAPAGADVTSWRY